MYDFRQLVCEIVRNRDILVHIVRNSAAVAALPLHIPFHMPLISAVAANASESDVTG